MKSRSLIIRWVAHLFMFISIIFTSILIYDVWNKNWYWASVFFVAILLFFSVAFLGYYFSRLETQAKVVKKDRLLSVVTMVVGARINAASSLPVNRAARRANRR